MKFFPFTLSALLLCTLASPLSQGAFDPTARIRLEPYIWRYTLEDFGKASYRACVETLLRQYEKSSKTPLLPQSKNEVVVLKVHVAHGRGLATPTFLTSGLIEALIQRGFAAENIYILGSNTLQLERCGYITDKIKDKLYFNGSPVYGLDSPEAIEKQYYYESELLPPPTQLNKPGDPLNYETDKLYKKSFLPALIVEQAKFWINLPIGVAHPQLEVEGALTNGSIRAVSNYERFLLSSTTGPIAVAEINALDPLQKKNAFHLLTLENYQFIGGPSFDSLYTKSEPAVLLSTNAVALDSIIYDIFNQQKKANGLPVPTNTPKLIRYGKQLGLGIYKPELLKCLQLYPPRNIEPLKSKQTDRPQPNKTPKEKQNP